MREILYRAKAINRDSGYHRTNYKNGDFVYGLVTRLYDERFENLPAEMTDINGITGIEVDYKTIGQYTGLTDKNGTRIFEHDIIIWGKIPCVVKWDKEYACFSLYKYGKFKVAGLNQDTMGLKEVIGNIHNTPELLKGENYGTGTGKA